MTAPKRRSGAARKAPLVGAPQVWWFDQPPQTQSEVARDPLGLAFLEDRMADAFWPGFGQRTTRAGYFVLVAGGLALAERAIDAFALPRDDDTRRFLFGRFERIWALSQFAATDGHIEADAFLGARGTAHVWAQTRRGGLPLDFAQLVQGEVGALGTYLPSLRAHRLVAPDRLRLEPLGWEMAQWLWNDPPASLPGADELVLKALQPRASTVPERTSTMTLANLGAASSLARLRQRPALQDFLWRHLIAQRPPPAALATLPVMATELQALQQAGVHEAAGILTALSTLRSGSNGAELSKIAKVALGFTALGHALGAVFAQIYQTLKDEGYAATWSHCVQTAITPELGQMVNTQLVAFRQLGGIEVVERLSSYGRLFGQAMRRFNTQNPYNTFESVMNVHAMAQRAMARGTSWIARTGEDVFLQDARTAGLDPAAMIWQPTFRMGTMQALLKELGQLA